MERNKNDGAMQIEILKDVLSDKPLFVNNQLIVGRHRSEPPRASIDAATQINPYNNVVHGQNAYERLIEENKKLRRFLGEYSFPIPFAETVDPKIQNEHLKYRAQRHAPYDVPVFKTQQWEERQKTQQSENPEIAKYMKMRQFAIDNHVDKQTIQNIDERLNALRNPHPPLFKKQEITESETYPENSDIHSLNEEQEITELENQLETEKMIKYSELRQLAKDLTVPEETLQFIDDEDNLEHQNLALQAIIDAHLSSPTRN